MFKRLEKELRALMPVKTKKTKVQEKSKKAPQTKQAKSATKPVASGKARLTEKVRVVNKISPPRILTNGDGPKPKGPRLPQFAFMKAPGMAHDFQVGDTVEAEETVVEIVEVPYYEYVEVPTTTVVSVGTPVLVMNGWRCWGWGRFPAVRSSPRHDPCSAPSRGAWWDGDYDGPYDNGYSARRGRGSTTTTTHRASPGYEQPPESGTEPGYESPGETPPENSPPPQCGQQGCTQYSPPPEESPPWRSWSSAAFAVGVNETG